MVDKVRDGGAKSTASSKQPRSRADYGPIMPPQGGSPVVMPPPPPSVQVPPPPPSSSSPPEKLTWDRHECAKQIGVSVRTLDRMVAEGRIPVLLVRSKKLFLPEAIRQWMKESQENVEG